MGVKEGHKGAYPESYRFKITIIITLHLQISKHLIKMGKCYFDREKKAEGNQAGCPRPHTSTEGLNW